MCKKEWVAKFQQAILGDEMFINVNTLFMQDTLINIDMKLCGFEGKLQQFWHIIFQVFRYVPGYEIYYRGWFRNLLRVPSLLGLIEVWTKK